jgi:hypothetical protein
VTIDCVEVTKLIYQRTLETVESLLVKLRVKRVSGGGGGGEDDSGKAKDRTVNTVL